MSTTDDRPTDTIRDAFEAMIAFLTILIGGPMPRAWPDIAAVAARAIGSQARTTEEADRAVAALASFRDLIQRAAEEHNRRTAAAGDFTPERIREARERCAEIDRRYQAGLESDSNREDLALTVLAIRAAREDLPAALAWGEHMQAERDTFERVAATWRTTADNYCNTIAERDAEIERLTAELAARAPAEGRVRYVLVCRDCGAKVTAGQSCKAAGCPPRAPADASLEARAALRDTFSKLVHIDHMARHLCENSGIDHTKDPPEATVDVADLTALGGALDAIDPTEEHDEGQRDRLMAVLDAVDASRPAAPVIDAEDLWTDYRTGRGTVFASDRKAFLAGVAAGRRTADASRPELTEEQARDEVRTVLGRFFAPTPTTTAAVNALVPLLRASRGETGPAPAGLTSAMHDAQQRPSVPPDPLALDPEDGTLCADCKTPRNGYHGALCSVRAGAKPGRVPDPRATLHASDPASPFAPGSLAAGSATEDRILDRKRGGK